METIKLNAGKIYNDSTIVIYHKKSNIFYCPDGIVSAYIANRFLKPNAMFAGTYYNNEDILKQIGKDNHVYMVDYSMKSAQLEKLLENNFVEIIDHHKTSINDLSVVKSPWLGKFFSLDHSGAYLTWQYFSKEEVPTIIKYIETGDLYKFDLPEAKLVCAGIYTLMHHSYNEDKVFYNIERFINHTEDELIDRFLPTGAKAIAENALRIKKHVDKAYKNLIWGNEVVVTEVTEYDADIVSKIGHNLCNENLTTSFAVIATTTDNGCFISFRSNGFDCEPIAKHFGGGGHPQSCGCKVDSLSELFDDYYNDEF